MIQWVVNKNLNFIKNELGIVDEYKIDDIRYGLETLIGETFKLTVIMSLSILIGKGIEFFTVTALLFTIRTAIGGTHAKSLMGCLVKSTILYMFLFFVSSKIHTIPIIVNYVCIAIIMYVLSTVKYKTKLDKSGNDEKKNLFLRLRLICTAGGFLLLTGFWFNSLYSLVFFTESIMILDYLKVRREENAKEIRVKE